MISFQDYVSEGISHRVFYGDLVYKLRRVKCKSHFVSSGSKMIKRLRRRKYGPLINERTIGLVLGPSTSLYRSFPKHCTLTNKAVVPIFMTGLVQTSSEEDKALTLVPLIFSGTPLVLGLELAFRRADHSLLWRISLYI